MLLFLCLTVAGAFGAGMAWAQLRQRTLPAPRGLPAPEPFVPFPARPFQDGLDEVWRLKPGDVLVWAGSDHAVSGVARMVGQGHHLLRVSFADEPDVALVCADAPSGAAWWCTRVKGVSPVPPTPDTLVYQGARHTRVRRWELASVDAPQAGTAVVQFFEGPDGTALWLWAAADGADALHARRLAAADLMVLQS